MYISLVSFDTICWIGGVSFTIITLIVNSIRVKAWNAGIDRRVTNTVFRSYEARMANKFYKGAIATLSIIAVGCFIIAIAFIPN